jgi:hypothetical protein
MTIAMVVQSCPSTLGTRISRPQVVTESRDVIYDEALRLAEVDFTATRELWEELCYSSFAMFLRE